MRAARAIPRQHICPRRRECVEDGLAGVSDQVLKQHDPPVICPKRRVARADSTLAGHAAVQRAAAPGADPTGFAGAERDAKLTRAAHDQPHQARSTARFPPTTRAANAGRGLCWLSPRRRPRTHRVHHLDHPRRHLSLAVHRNAGNVQDFEALPCPPKDRSSPADDRW